MSKTVHWVATRNGEPCGVFENREDAVKWLKDMLKQRLEDFDRQDNKGEYDYPIKLGSIEIKPVETRETFLGF